MTHTREAARKALGRMPDRPFGPPQWFCADCLEPYCSSYRALGAKCDACGMTNDGERVGSYWLHRGEVERLAAVSFSQGATNE